MPQKVVGRGGLEPPLHTEADFKSAESTNFSTGPFEQLLILVLKH